MMSQKKQLYIFLCSCSLLLSILALILNIKTLPLIKQTQQNSKQITQLKEINRHLEYQIQKQSTYESIEEKALQLKMTHPSSRKITHYYLAQ